MSAAVDRQVLDAVTRERDEWRRIAAVRNREIAQLAEDRDRFRDFAYLARERLHKIAKQCMCPDGRCAECAEIWSVLNQCPATVEHASTKVRK